MKRLVALILIIFILLSLPITTLGKEMKAPFGSYRKALPGYVYRFPRDHYAHTDYKTEWWYVTGHLKDANNHPYGYELTFFRVGTDATAAHRKAFKNSPWALDTVYLAHAALTDEDAPEASQFTHATQLLRPAMGQAGSVAMGSNIPFKVWAKNWDFTQKAPTTKSSLTTFTMQANFPSKKSLRLTLTSTLPPVIHGINGVSQKAACVGCASHYYSYTRMKAVGTVVSATSKGKPVAVSGTAWMDHEFGSNQLQANQVGWDWFALQLDNRQDVMLYQMRLQDGKKDPHSSGTVVASRGKSTHLSEKDFVITPLRYWKSPTTLAKYPAQWRVQVPQQQLDVTLTPVVANQELGNKASAEGAYWEGKCRVKGTQFGKPITGQAYVELTGYAKRLSF
ncbi:MAG: lipocalin-like domain-containing protein [Vampirovibrionales bacterium]|nr:lipocalin-like domain-containing protein [Vampirovibrionales bacterium]